ncbi:MAG: PH domain-containing protein [Candidatus Lokiarchaeota archaeon]|nr:PH domain-containing protein [Candidatus Lokiarchaeota archaeon]
MMSDLSLPKGVGIPTNEEILLRFKREYTALILPYLINIGILLLSLLIIFIIINVIVLGFTGINILIVAWWTIVSFFNISIWIILGVIGGLMVVPIIGYFYTRSHVYIITNKRFIVYWKFLFINIRETKIEKVTDMIVHQGLWGRVFHFGDINPITPGQQMSLPVQGQSQANFNITSLIFGGSGSSGGMGPTSFNQFTGVKFPFDVLYKFKSIDRYGKVLDANR